LVGIIISKAPCSHVCRTFDTSDHTIAPKRSGVVYYCSTKLQWDALTCDLCCNSTSQRQERCHRCTRTIRPGSRNVKTLVLETTAPFQGLPELVAYEEGLFEKEGLHVEWADREQGVEKKVDVTITSPKGVNPFTSHGKLFEKGQADMYNACEW